MKNGCMFNLDFEATIAHRFWLRRRFQRLVTPGTQKLGRRQNSPIWSFLAVFMGNSTQFFLAPRRFQWLVTPGIRKLGRRQNSPIWSVLAVFMGNSTHFFWLWDDFNAS